MVILYIYMPLPQPLRILKHYAQAIEYFLYYFHLSDSQSLSLASNIDLLHIFYAGLFENEDLF